MYNLGYQKVENFFTLRKKINRRLCEICFIGSHKTKCVSLDINLLLPQKYTFWQHIFYSSNLFPNKKSYDSNCEPSNFFIFSLFAEFYSFLPVR